ncbi:replication protein A 30 kDa subunit-like [Dipodomys merriami]|uniref:replication protein A 30 kDa subunit-like n=1 Tax=Dipodomys merriami TaxID=94247 RepID=UPI003855C72E
MVNNVFTLNGHEVGRVSVTGVVKKIEVTSKFIRYQIDDMTSQPIGALEDVDEENGTQLVTVGAYVKAFGVLQCSGGANILKIACIHPLKNMNELTIHIVETVNAHMILGKSYPVYIGQRIASETEPAMASATSGRNEASGRESSEDSSGSQSSDQECSSNESSQEGSSHENSGILKSPRESTHVEEVLHLIHKCTLMEGKSLSDLQRELPSLTAENLQQAIKRLIGEGHIHTTADAEHFTCAV